MTSAKRRRGRGQVSTAKKLVFSFTTCLLVILVLAVLFEISLRLLFQRIERITGAGQWQVGSFGALTYLWDQYHPRYGWTNLPGYQSDDRVPFQVTINRQGLRGSREYSPLAAAGVRRIAVLGNSCTFGEEVDDDETIPFYLEQHLKDAEALNFGVHGFGLGQMALRLEDEVFEFHPDHVVVVLLLPMDIYRDAMREYVYNKPVFSVTAGGLQIANVPVPEVSQQPWILRNCFTAAWFFGRPKDFAMPDNPANFLAIAHAILRRIRTQCDRHQVPVTLVTLVSYGTLNDFRKDPMERAYIHHLVQSLQGSSVEVLDLVGFLEEIYSQEDAALTQEMGHWSPRGNDLIAGKIAEHLAGQSADWSLPN